MQRIAMQRSSARAEPGLVVEPSDVHYQRVSLPMTDRIPHEGRLHIVRMPASVRRDHAKRMERLVEKRHFVLGLNNLNRQRHRSDSWNAYQQTPPAGIVDLPAVADFFKLRL